MEKHGFVVIECPRCGVERVHSVAVVGEEMFLCCRGCFETRRGLDREVPFDFQQRGPPGSPREPSRE